MQRLRRLVCGTDFSAGADRALAISLELAAAAGAGITLVHVCVDDVDDRRLLDYDVALGQALARLENRGVEVAGVLRAGRPWEKLDNVAAEVGASLIVVGRQGAGRSVGLGSVAEHLVRTASRPVLIVASDLHCLDLEASATNRP